MNICSFLDLFFSVLCSGYILISVAYGTTMIISIARLSNRSSCQPAKFQADVDLGGGGVGRKMEQNCCLAFVQGCR